MGESYFELAHKKHLEVLKQRIQSSSDEEINVIAETIFEMDPDIFLRIIHNKLKGDNV